MGINLDTKEVYFSKYHVTPIFQKVLGSLEISCCEVV